MNRKEPIRTARLQYTGWIPLSHSPSVEVMGYANHQFVCRVEITRAGLAIYAGTRGKLKLANWSWDRLVDRLWEDRQRRRPRHRAARKAAATRRARRR